MKPAIRHSREILKRHFTIRWLSRLWILAFMAVLSLVMAVLGAPVAAADGTSLQLTASTSTSVGYQTFANVSLAGVTDPTGIVTFRMFSINDPNCASPAVFTSQVQATGTSVTSDRFTTINAGTNHWEASYSGDPNNSAASLTSCSDTGASVDVARFYTNLAVSAGAPSDGTIQVSAAVYGYKPRGTVTFYLTPPGDSFCSGPPVFTSTVKVNGIATYTSAPYEYPIGGQYKWRATYSGDHNNLAFPITGCLDGNASVTVP